MKNIDKIITESINRFLHENLENEYLDKDFGIPLKRYMNMSDTEKQEEWLYSYTYFVEGWVINTDLSYYGMSEEEIEAMKEGDCETYYDILSKYPEAMDDCISFVQDKTKYNGDIPTFDIMDYTRDVHNEWLIHFSDNATQISYQGFKYATDDVNDLGYSNAGETRGKSSEGWDFAYLADECPRDGDKYGQDAVMFQASGIKATHYGDQEEQVMFWNKDAKNIVLIQNNKDSYRTNSHGDYVRDWFITSTITDEVIYDADEIDDVIIWVQNNFAQYRKHLIEPKESKMRHKSMQDSIHTSAMNYAIERQNNK